MSLINELKRRRVVRVAVGYVVAAWVVAQVADLVADSFLAPPWIMQAIILVLIVGLPLALVLSWVFDLTPDGIQRTEDSEPDGDLSVSARWILAAAAAAFVVGAFAVFLIWPAVSTGERSVAVLPLDDISPEADQAYLANGIADELRLELQRLEGLRVAGRTSSNAFAEEDSQTIGERLSVDAILEGSIRKDGDRVRIAVELINVADGFVLWSQRYDRELDRIFEMQEEIATEVAARLGVTLGVGGINAFRGAGTRNVEAYEAYLRARGNRYTDLGTDRAIPMLERAIDLDPDYAVAWSELAIRSMSGLWGVSLDERPVVIERALRLAERAVELDPQSAGVKSALAVINLQHYDWISGERNHLQAVELLSDRLTIDRYAGMLSRAGRMSEAEKQYHAAVEAEPVDGRLNPQVWRVYLAQGRFDEAQQILDFRQSRDLHEDSIDVAFSEGDPARIKAVIQAYPESDPAFSTLYGHVLAEFASPERIYAVLEKVYRDEELQWPRKLHDVSMVAAYFGFPEFALEVKDREARVSPLRLGAIFDPVMADVRRLPGFKDLVTDLNLVEYWRTYGWADACEPLGNDDFTCS